MLVDMVFTQGQQIRSTTACCFVGGASQLTCSTCKSFRAPPFMLLVVLYNFIYYNCIIITHLLVGWLVRGNKGVCVNKKVHCDPVHTCIPNMIEYDYHYHYWIWLCKVKVHVYVCTVIHTYIWCAWRQWVIHTNTQPDNVYLYWLHKWCHIRKSHAMIYHT